MLSPDETRDLKRIYYILLVFSVAKCCCNLVPNVSIVITVSYMEWGSKEVPANITNVNNATNGCGDHEEIFCDNEMVRFSPVSGMGDFSVQYAHNARAADQDQENRYIGKKLCFSQICASSTKYWNFGGCCV
ncbi:unnamed protein product [Orchesella dallaii]|uniref:Uncharacterized protein n=1 Tax=Orchesella dallaii TaxID=48710 RepID=A0ABP1S7J4_9HEXA